jgi:NitT/TauT family transport system substrate-binding protein
MTAGLIRLACAALALCMPLAARAETLNVGKGGPQAFPFAVVDVAIAEGFLQKRGLDAQLSNFDSATKIHQALATGDIDIALASGPDMAFIAKGSPARSIAAMAGRPDSMGLVVAADSSIRTAEGLKGKNVSVTSTGSLTNWLAHELSKQQGWGADGINVLALGAQTSQVAALKTHQTDAMVMDLTGAHRLEDLGEVRILVHFGTIVPDFHTHVIHATNKFLASNPDAARRFLAAWFEAVAFMRSHKPETVKITANVMGVSEHLADLTYDDMMPMMSTDGCFDKKALAVLRRSYVEIGLLTEEPDMASLYTEEYLPAPCRH